MAAAPTPLPPAARPDRARAAAAIVALVAAALAALLAFRHHDGIADPDAINMAAAMAHGLQPGVPFHETLLYGRLVSPGVYHAFHALGPALVRTPARTVGALNAVALIAAALLPWPLFALYRRRFGVGVAFAATLIVLLTPLVWEVGCSFHPAGPAALLLALAILAHGRAARSAVGASWWALGALLGFAALCTRAEVALVAPALLLAAAWRTGGAGARLDRGTLAAAMASIALAVGGFLLVAHGISRAAGGGSDGLASYGAGYIATYWRAAVLPSATVWTSLTMGLATVAVTLGGLAAASRRRRGGAALDPAATRGVIVALVWALPIILFWLPNQAYMVRHFLLAVPALVWIAAETVLRHLARPARIALAGAMVIANLLVPEALYAGWNLAHRDHPKAPNGTFFSWHRREAALIERYRRIGDVALANRAGAFVQVDWGSNGYLLLGMAKRPEPYALLSTSEPFPGATLVRYRQGPAELRLLMSQLAWPLEPPGAARRRGARRAPRRPRRGAAARAGRGARGARRRRAAAARLLIRV